MRGGVFLDRDGTLIELVHHLTDPAEVALVPGAGEALARLRAAGWPVILVTNQSVIGRGLLTEAGLARVHDEMHRQLGFELDGIYFCPLKPTQTDPAVIEDPMRKPGPGMLLEAAEKQSLNLADSWMVGDTVSDIEAGRNAGCRTILVETGYGAGVDGYKGYDHRVATLAEAATLILNKDMT